MKNLILYYNSYCSKSRAALALLEKSKVSFTVVEYLLTPPSETLLDSLLGQLKMEPEQIVRKGEDEFEALEKKKKLPTTRKEWIQLLASTPILIERPIVSDGTSAVLGRPPEKITEWLNARTLANTK